MLSFSQETKQSAILSLHYKTLMQFFFLPSLIFRFPASEYPVIALMGAPGEFPVREHNWWLQKFVHWSKKIKKKAKEFIKSVLNNEPFVGIHLRNGVDFVSSFVLFWNKKLTQGTPPSPFHAG